MPRIAPHRYHIHAVKSQRRFPLHLDTQQPEGNLPACYPESQILLDQGKDNHLEHRPLLMRSRFQGLAILRLTHCKDP